MSTSTPKTIFLKDYAPPAFLVASVDLDIDLRDEQALVSARLTIARNSKSSEPTAPLVLDGDELVLVSVTLDGKTLAERDFTLSEERLEIAGVPERFTLQTSVRICPT